MVVMDVAMMVLMKWIYENMVLVLVMVMTMEMDVWMMVMREDDAMPWHEDVWFDDDGNDEEYNTS